MEVSVPPAERTGADWLWRCADELRQARDRNHGLWGQGWIDDSSLADDFFDGKGLYYLMTDHPVAHFYIDVMPQAEEQAAAWQEKRSISYRQVNDESFVNFQKGELRLRVIHWTQNDPRVQRFFDFFRPILQHCTQSGPVSSTPETK